ncbi:twin-arginine translocation signal domain-containing protein [Desulfobulbus sp. US1]|nr:twin-arginine translocation signal domain-containing protein [Desulfobulbus sp. US4]MCW5207623.1 twin-arginine translocation signal domain-containing protein [Desulfobulbus sp. US2]MCW5209233.1 twin-arginine translocation signal domain-containing protein [Desulfobulbus sp. US1]MCW5214270.1 twin-arginine translocation signal domain-containing protein [Desulfobulbus sp. US5]WLE96410.1 MAG: twin-arginine translocation signal domain-containing protein [Candidatus Electrothrix communis]
MTDRREFLKTTAVAASFCNMHDLWVTEFTV